MKLVGEEDATIAGRPFPDRRGMREFDRSAAVNILLKHTKLAGRPAYVPNRVLLMQALTAVRHWAHDLDGSALEARARIDPLGQTLLGKGRQFTQANLQVTLAFTSSELL